MIDYYIVAIGMSAGGLSALEELLMHLPESLNASLVILNHLPVESKSQLDRIVGRLTRLPVQWMSDQEPMQKGRCYLLPAGQQVTLKDGKFQLQPRASQSKVNRTIDTFYVSVSQEVNRLAIGVILSGTGEDGLVGVQAIEERGGIVMVQTPESARFSGMPWAIVARDHPDFILTPQEISRALVGFLKVSPV